MGYMDIHDLFHLLQSATIVTYWRLHDALEWYNGIDSYKVDGANTK